MWIRKRRAWELRGLDATAESAYWNRREFLRAAGFGSLSLFSSRFAAAQDGRADPDAKLSSGKRKLYPAKRNEKFKLDREPTDELHATSYNNFYEFAFTKYEPRTLSRKMKTSPWKLKIDGEVEKPIEVDVDDLLARFPLEERLYRFRCVEAWAMIVPWTGFALADLVKWAKPLSSAKYLRFETFNKPEWGRGFSYKEYPWPYHEGLTMAEATNELAMLVTGAYGKKLPKQNGAPIRLITPWKYGFKSIKSIVRISFVKERPKTFWNTVVPEEYPFEANVDPDVPHPRWSQKMETLIDTRIRVPTLPYNGYAEQVAGLYKKRVEKD